MVLVSFAPDITEYVALVQEYRDCKHVGNVLEEIIGGKRDVALINPKMVYNTTHLQQAIFRALTKQASNTLTSKSVHSEVIINISPANNIGAALTSCGVSADTPPSCLLAVTLVAGNATDETTWARELHEALGASGAGDTSIKTLEDLQSVLQRERDVDAIMSKFKLKESEKKDDKGVSDGILTRLATKDLSRR